MFTNHCKLAKTKKILLVLSQAHVNFLSQLKNSLTYFKLPTGNMQETSCLWTLAGLSCWFVGKRANRKTSHRVPAQSKSFQERFSKQWPNLNLWLAHKSLRTKRLFVVSGEGPPWQTVDTRIIRPLEFFAPIPKGLTRALTNSVAMDISRERQYHVPFLRFSAN